MEPQNRESLHYLALWHLERNNFGLARQYFAGLVVIQCNDPSVWLSFAIVCAIDGEIHEAHQALAEVAKLVPKPEEDLRIKFCQGLLCERRHKHKEAMDLYYHSIEQCELKQGQEEGRIEEAVAAGEVDSENAAIKREAFYRELKLEILLRVALVKKDRGESGDAIVILDLIARESPPPSRELRANALCLRGVMAEMQSNYSHAQRLYAEVIELVPQHSTALERLGRVYLRYRECIPSAVSCFFRAIESNPCSSVSWYLLGRCYTATAQYTEAREAYSRAINIDPNDAQVWCSLGILYYAHGQYDESEGLFERALRVDPTMAEAWYNLGALCSVRKDQAGADNAYAKARAFGLSQRLLRTGLVLTGEGEG